MGNSCHCSDTQIEKENSTQYEFGERENIITQIKSKFEKKYNTSEYITKEDFNKLLLSFPNCQELISDLEKNNSDQYLNLKNDELKKMIMKLNQPIHITMKKNIKKNMK